MERKHTEPWDQNVYQTGITEPPKKRHGCMTALLILVILLGGIATLMGLLNIRLFRAVTSGGEQNATIGFMPEQTTPTEPSVPEETETGEGLSLTLDPAPEAVENIPQEGGLSLQAIYEKAMPSVVSVITDSGSGSGVVLSADGYIVTAGGLLTGATADVLLTDGRKLPATVVGKDKETDLAVLQVEATDLVPAQFGDDSALRPGDSVVTIGDPLGAELRGTMTEGMVAAINRDVAVGDRTVSLIQTDSVQSAGNAGGPLLNCYGQVVGIHAMPAIEPDGASAGISLAIPSTHVKEIVDQLVRQGRVMGRPRLGLEVQNISPFDRLYYRLPQGLYITGVQAGTDVAQKGVQPGDILLKFNGKGVYDGEGLRDMLYTFRPGDMVELTIYRDGSQHKINVLLMEETN